MCERREALQFLDEALTSKVTLIVGPAGYGKTTIITQWCERLAERQLQFSYYSATEREREASTFLAMFVQSLEIAGVDVNGGSAWSSSDFSVASAIEYILLRLELSDRPLVVILDDYERVENPETNSLIKAFVEAMPATVHLVLVSRRRPQIPVAALDVRGEVRLIDAARLRLNRNELAWLLDLTPESKEAAEIALQTEGWPVAVQLYRLWLERRPPEHAPRFGGHIAEVTDYLTEQLFSSLAPAHQALLIDISNCEEVAPGFVDCMRQRADSALLLDEAAACLSGLVRVLDGPDEPVYRLHPLLSEYLRARLLKEPKRVAQLSANAALGHLRHQRYAEAVRSALDGHDDAVMAQVLRALRPIHVLLGHGVAMLRAILREIPESFIAKHPRLQLIAALAHFKSGFFAEARVMLDRVRESTDAFTRDPDGEPRWLIADGNLVDCIFLGQLERPSPRADELYNTIMAASGDDPILWGACENVMMLISQQRGDLKAASDSICKARRMYASVELARYGHLQVIGHELLVALAAADLRAASELIATYQKRPTLECEDDISIPSMLKLTLAAIRYERDFDDPAVDLMQKALAEHGLSESWFDQYAITYPCVLMRLNLLEGRSAVFHFIAKARAHAATVGIEALGPFLDTLDIEYRVRNGDIAGAEALAESVALQLRMNCAETRESLPWRERDGAMQSLVLLRIAQQRTSEALHFARLLAAEGLRGRRLRTQIKGLILTALALAADGQRKAACAELHKAVVLAYPQGFVAPFAEEGAQLASLIAELSADPDCDAFAQRHIKSLQRVIAEGMAGPAPTDLNERERDILACLADGASNKMVGRRLGITENTVKFHLKKIFFKLDVSTRRAAVAKCSGRIPPSSARSEPPGLKVAETP